MKNRLPKDKPDPIEALRSVGMTSSNEEETERIKKLAEEAGLEHLTISMTEIVEYFMDLISKGHQGISSADFADHFGIDMDQANWVLEDLQKDGYLSFTPTPPPRTTETLDSLSAEMTICNRFIPVL